MSYPLTTHDVLKQPGLTSVCGTSDATKFSVTVRLLDGSTTRAPPLLLPVLRCRARSAKSSKSTSINLVGVVQMWAADLHGSAFGILQYLGRTSSFSPLTEPFLRQNGPLWQQSQIRSIHSPHIQYYSCTVICCDVNLLTYYLNLVLRD